MIYVDPVCITDQLYAYRLALGLERIQLAELMLGDEPTKTVKGLAAQLWFWETGRRQPLPHQLGPWLKALGVRLAIVPAEEGERS
jgi:hypothetical protein